MAQSRPAITTRAARAAKGSMNPLRRRLATTTPPTRSAVTIPEGDVSTGMPEMQLRARENPNTRLNTKRHRKAGFRGLTKAAGLESSTLSKPPVSFKSARFSLARWEERARVAQGRTAHRMRCIGREKRSTARWPSVPMRAEAQMHSMALRMLSSWQRAIRYMSVAHRLPSCQRAYPPHSAAVEPVFAWRPTRSVPAITRTQLAVAAQGPIRVRYPRFRAKSTRRNGHMFATMNRVSRATGAATESGAIISAFSSRLQAISQAPAAKTASQGLVVLIDAKSSLPFSLL